MKVLARTILEMAAFLELSDESSVNEDDAVRAMESVAARLRSSSDAERAALREAAADLARASAGPAKRFYREFLSAVGLDEDKPAAGKPTAAQAPSASDRRALARAVGFESGDAEAVRRLLARRPKLADAELDSGGNRPLHLASLYGHREIVKLLLGAGADPRARNRHRYTPLHDAVTNNHKSIVEMLVAAGVDVNAKGWARDTPLALAIERKRKAVAEILRRHGGIP